MNIIFLDLDGPMIPNWGKHRKQESFLLDVPFWTGFAEKAKVHIRELVTIFQAKIVTNSTHNSGRFANTETGAAHIFNVFKANDMEDLLHDTDWTTNYQNYEKVTSDNRSHAILSWLDTYPEVTNFVIFDDEIKDYAKTPLISRFVQTGTNGITYRNYKKAGNILA